MSREDLEADLHRLGENWPAPSVAEAVMGTIAALPTPAPPVSLWRRWRMAFTTAAAALVLSAAGAWFFILSTPRTLFADVQQALDEAGTAHIVISGLNETGVPQKADIWYSRTRGFRLESPEGIIVDDGRQQWSWKPKAADAAEEPIVARRSSTGAAAMIAGMFRLDGAPADWKRQAVPEHDREIGGRKCRGFVVVPPASTLASPDAPLRFIVQVDPDERIVQIEHQRQVQGEWHSGRTITIAYSVQIADDKIAADFSEKVKVVEADQALDERFPISRAIATDEANGLLFAVHEAARGEEGGVYIVSSVRGTPEYLRKFPPQSRMINLQTRIVDVAEQPQGPGSSDGMSHRMTLASAESNGVHYLWWMALPRQFFKVEQGERKPVLNPPALEATGGRLRLPLQALPRDPRAGTNWVTAVLDVPLPAGGQSTPLREIAARARRDVLQIRQTAGPIVALHGAIRNDTLRFIQEPESVSDDEYSAELKEQLAWLRSMDEVKDGRP